MKLGQTLPLCDIVHCHSGITKAEIQKIVATGCEHLVDGKVSPRVNDTDGTLNPDYRKSQVCWWNENYVNTYELHDTLQKIYDVVNYVNDEFYQFDLSNIQPLQFTRYHQNDKGFYFAHTDCGSLEPKIHRKLSFVIFLSNPEEYEGGEFVYYTGREGNNINQTKPEMINSGNMIVFPSFLMHEVTEVTKGTRYSLVGWCEGPRFK